uniref:Delta(3,5)-Delta(2,4)-dienoyl-CoA isomerase, mitochondrial n=1 Tax=Biomphalaria glabrata TaxID=6526 RepID=A0A2C9JJ34_BIOGL
MKPFSEWLHEVPGDSQKAYCSFCKCEIIAKFHQLTKHSEAKKHINAIPDQTVPLPLAKLLTNAETNQKSQEYTIKVRNPQSESDTHNGVEEENHKEEESEDGIYIVERIEGQAQRSLNKVISIQAKAMTSTTGYEFETLKITSPKQFIKNVELNRPDKRNAMNTTFWKDIYNCFTKLSVDPDCRVIVLSGAGKMFTAGLDLYENEIFKSLLSSDSQDSSRKSFKILKGIQELQESFNVIEKCPKPVIAAVHNGCIGGGIDMIACCDMRYCTQDAWFQIKEVDIGLAADLGTLQRFPKIIGNDSLYRELAYTGRKFDAEEAKSIGFVSRILPDKNTLLEAAILIAEQIASKSPVAVQGIKVNSVYSRDHGVYQGLEYMATWNSTMLQSEDVGKAVSAAIQKETPVFSKL